MSAKTSGTALKPSSWTSTCLFTAAPRSQGLGVEGLEFWGFGFRVLGFGVSSLRFGVSVAFLDKDINPKGPQAQKRLKPKPDFFAGASAGLRGVGLSRGSR